LDGASWIGYCRPGRIIHHRTLKDLLTLHSGPRSQGDARTFCTPDVSCYTYTVCRFFTSRTARSISRKRSWTSSQSMERQCHHVFDSQKWCRAARCARTVVSRRVYRVIRRVRRAHCRVAQGTIARRE
jgi:hypothetical protein